METLSSQAVLCNAEAGLPGGSFLLMSPLCSKSTLVASRLLYETTTLSAFWVFPWSWAALSFIEGCSNSVTANVQWFRWMAWMNAASFEFSSINTMSFLWSKWISRQRRTSFTTSTWPWLHTICSAVCPLWALEYCRSVSLHLCLWHLSQYPVSHRALVRMNHKKPARSCSQAQRCPLGIVFDSISSIFWTPGWVCKRHFAMSGYRCCAARCRAVFPFASLIDASLEHWRRSSTTSTKPSVTARRSAFAHSCVSLNRFHRSNSRTIRTWPFDAASSMGEAVLNPRLEKGWELTDPPGFYQF